MCVWAGGGGVQCMYIVGQHGSLSLIECGVSFFVI